MKTAFLYCGQARSIARTWANHVFHLHRKFEHADIFVSVADDPEADDMLTLHNGWPLSPWRMEKVTQPAIPDPEPRCSWHSGYPPSSTPLGINRQLWALNRCWEFFCEHANPTDYDLIVRVRPDSVFYRMEIPRFQPAKASWEPHPEGTELLLPHTCKCAWWSRWGGVNDRFALLGQVAAEAYFTCFQRRQELWDAWCPLHPETMMMQNLRMRGIEPDDTLKAEFGTLRSDGSIIGMDASVVDISDYARNRP